MALQPPTVEILKFLNQNPSIRAQIRATPGNTLLYAGNFFKPVWREIEEMKRTLPQAAMKQTLPDVLARIPVPGKPFSSLLAYVQDIERRVPWKPDGFTIWRALSGILAANAIGPVSFYIGSGVSKVDKVFAATEMSVLERNPNVDAITKDVLAYYQRCIQNKQAAMNFGYFSG